MGVCAALDAGGVEPGEAVHEAVADALEGDALVGVEGVGGGDADEVEADFEGVVLHKGFKRDDFGRIHWERLEGFAGGVAFVDAVPEGDVVFSTHPAEEDFLAFAMGEEVHEAGFQMPHDDAPVGNFAGEVGGCGHGGFDGFLGGGDFLLHAALAVAAALSIDVDGVLLEAVFFFSGGVELGELLGEPGEHGAGFF